MEIVCPSCSSAYEIDAAALGPQGRRVRCNACGTLWHAGPADAVTAATSAEGTGQEQARAKGPRRVKWTKDKSRLPRKTPMGQGALAAVLGLIVIAAGALLVMQRETMVGLFPQTATLFSAVGLPVNLRGLEIRAVTPRLTEDDGTRLLMVEGEIANITGETRPVPRLRFAVLGDRGQELFVWTAPADAASLPPGQTIRFRRRLASPPADGTGVNVRFVTRGDIVAGLN